MEGIRLRDGKAEWYRNRFVGSKELSNFRGQRYRRSELERLNGRTKYQCGQSQAKPPGNGRGRQHASGATYELETVGRNDFGCTLPGAFTAHPKIDPVSGEMHAMVYAWPQWMDHVQYVVVGTDGKVRKTVDVPLPG